MGIACYLQIYTRFILDAFPSNYEKKIGEFHKGIEVDKFKNYPFLLVTSGNRIRTLFDHYINSHGISINITLEIESIETLLSLACEGMDATIYPEMFVKNLRPLSFKSSTGSLTRNGILPLFLVISTKQYRTIMMPSSISFCIYLLLDPRIQ